MTTDHRGALDLRREAEEAAAHFPALLIEAERLAQTVAAGMHGRRRAGPGETFWQHRAYAFGDPVSTIDWRQSARVADRLYVRENEWEAAAAVYIWRDPSRSLDYASAKNQPTKRRRADILSVALAILLSKAGERVGLLGHAQRPFHGRHAPARLLEALHIDQFANTGDGAPPRQDLPLGARVVLISDFFTGPDAISDALREFAAAGISGVLLQICDPAEEDFPFQGRVEFSDPESKDKIIFGKAGAVRRDYQNFFTAHRAALIAAAQKAGWRFVTHRTDRAAHAALLALYSALGDPKIRKA